MNSTITSKQLFALKDRCLEVIADLHMIQKDVEAILERETEAGIKLTEVPNETEIQRLGRLATECTERACNLQRLEQLSTVKDRVASFTSPQPTGQSWAARKLSRLAEMIG